MSVPRGTSSDKADRPVVYRIQDADYDVESLVCALSPLPDLVSDSRQPATVLLKPNLLAPRPPETAVVTHPVFVEAVARLFLGKGHRVLLGDSPGFAPLGLTLRSAGYAGFMQRLGIEAADFSNSVTVPGRFYKRIAIARAVLDADIVVNLPKLKTHGQMGLSLAVKNLFGCVPGLEKARWHLATGQDAAAFARLLLDIAEIVKPHYSLLDGIVAMEGRGPSHGTPRRLGVVFASANTGALDAAVADFFGAERDAIPTLRYADGFYGSPVPAPAVVQLGEAAGELPRLSDFKMPGAEALARPLLFPAVLWGLLRRLVSPYPVAEPARCTGCGACAGICPVDALSLANDERGGRNGVTFDYSRCIRCFCCEEACTQAAIRARTPLLGRILRRDQRV